MDSTDERPCADAILATYPRPRPALPPEQRASYVEHYRSNRGARRGLSRVVAKLEAWMHRRVADGMEGGQVLEIGAGNLNHVPYLPADCIYDAVEPFRELWLDSPHRLRIHQMYSDLDDIPPGVDYDCIFSIAVLEHLTDLPMILARSALLLRAGGTFKAGFPSEGGLLWGLSWRVTTGVEYRLKRGLDYGLIMRHEHLNQADEILILLDYFYEQVEVSRFPLPFGHFSFYAAATARRPRLNRCLGYSAARLSAGAPR